MTRPPAPGCLCLDGVRAAFLSFFWLPHHSGSPATPSPATQPGSSHLRMRLSAFRKRRAGRAALIFSGRGEQERGHLPEICAQLYARPTHSGLAALYLLPLQCCAARAQGLCARFVLYLCLRLCSYFCFCYRRLTTSQLSRSTIPVPGGFCL